MPDGQLLVPEQFGTAASVDCGIKAAKKTATRKLNLIFPHKFECDGRVSDFRRRSSQSCKSILKTFKLAFRDSSGELKQSTRHWCVGEAAGSTAERKVGFPYGMLASLSCPYDLSEVRRRRSADLILKFS